MSKYTARHMAIVVPCEHWLNEVSVDVVQGNAWNCFLGYCVLLCDLKGFFFFFFCLLSLHKGGSHDWVDSFYFYLKPRLRWTQGLKQRCVSNFADQGSECHSRALRKGGWIVVAHRGREHFMQGLELEGQSTTELWLNCTEGWEAEGKDEQMKRWPSLPTGWVILENLSSLTPFLGALWELGVHLYCSTCRYLGHLHFFQLGELCLYPWPLS